MRDDAEDDSQMPQSRAEPAHDERKEPPEWMQDWLAHQQRQQEGREDDAADQSAAAEAEAAHASAAASFPTAATLLERGYDFSSAGLMGGDPWKQAQAYLKQTQDAQITGAQTQMQMQWQPQQRMYPTPLQQQAAAAFAFQSRFAHHTLARPTGPPLHPAAAFPPASAPRPPGVRSLRVENAPVGRGVLIFMDDDDSDEEGNRMH